MNHATGTGPLVLEPLAHGADAAADGQALAAVRDGLDLIVRSGGFLLEEAGLHAFAAGVVTQLAALLGVPAEGLVCARGEQPSRAHRLLAAAGRFAALIERPLEALPDERARRLLADALQRGADVHGDDGGIALHLGRENGRDIAAFVDRRTAPGAAQRQLLQAFCSNLGDLARSRRLLERLHAHAYYDPLVRLPNRAHFIERVDTCVRRGSPDHILALVDIDDFGATNEVMGHRFGDRLLELVAQRLADALPGEVLLARVGPDTFGVLGPTLQVVPQRLLESAQQPLAVDGVPHKVSLTCGYVLLPGAAQAGVDLVKDATIALKRAKRDRRGQYLQYSDHMGAEARARALLLSNLRAAIDGEQLFLAYQPQIDLQTRALVGLEALIRWRTEDGRFVLPEQFIPVAEHSGLIVALGQWVLAQACGTMRRLLDAGLAPQRMAVNVSVAQLRDSGFLAGVRTALAHSGLQGRQLELEITESVAVLPTQLLESTLAALRAEGISIAIDDFGTGYSSLSYLERLPLDRIKIDRSFVRQLGQPRGPRIAEMVAQLGRQLGLQVLAEGIEDAAAWSALRAMGCHEGQGYHIAPPMDQAALLRWLQARI